MSRLMDTNEARVAKDRINNATKLAVRPRIGSSSRIGPRGDLIDPQIGTQGAIALALLDVANAIRDRDVDPKTRALMVIADSLVDAILDGADDETVKKIAEAFQLESQGMNYDQIIGTPRRLYERNRTR